MDKSNSPGPVFLLASERSGTNLLRRRLTEWQSTYFGPSPTHIFKHLQHVLPFYGSLNDDGNFRDLIADALCLCYEHFSPWEIQLDVDNVLNGYTRNIGTHRSLTLLLDYLNQTYASWAGRTTYFCKDNHLFNFAYQIRNELPLARFVFLHRDPRDYALSQVRRLLGRSSITHAANMWRDEQLRCLQVVSNPAFSACCFRLSYEQLIHDERATLAELCRFLGVTMHDSPQSAQKYDQGTTTDWSNLDRPTMTDNCGKYKTGLSRTAVRAIESIVWSPMKLLGYTPVSDTRPSLSTYYRRVEPMTTLAWDAARRPFNLHRDSPGRLKRTRAIRTLQAKF
jgi:hypothetical protein